MDILWTMALGKGDAQPGFIGGSYEDPRRYLLPRARPCLFRLLYKYNSIYLCIPIHTPEQQREHDRRPNKAASLDILISIAVGQVRRRVLTEAAKNTTSG